MEQAMNKYANCPLAIELIRIIIQYYLVFKFYLHSLFRMNTVSTNVGRIMLTDIVSE